MSREQKCRVCGCTEDHACWDPRQQENCHWVAPDLCSACVPVDAKGKLDLGPLDFAALETVPDLGLRLDARSALQLMAALQLALRHPEFPEHSRETVMEIATVLAGHLSVTAKLQKVCLSGFPAVVDVPVEKSAIILPPGFCGE